jgi:SAM-dependent methyltransferase
MKKLIPVILKIIPRRHLIRLSYIFMRISALFYKGNNVECPVCNSRFRRFLPYGHNIIRENALCPKCLSLERHRLMWLFLRDKTEFFTASLKVLHVAPEQCFYSRFKKLHNLDYITADLESPIADIRLDIQKMPFEDNEFDVIICNHVLEHVEDDKKAMAEILRVLKKGGFALMHVPIDYSRNETYENNTITEPKDREKHFRQKDHYRLYGRDFPERMKEAGFLITDDNYTDELDKETFERYRLIKNEYMFAYRKY